MKILHVDSGREWRGGQAQVFLLAQGLRDRGHDQVLAVPPGSPLYLKARDARLEVAPVPLRGDLDAAACLRLTALARRFRPEIVHAHTAHAHMAGVSAARLAGVPGRVVTRRTALPVGRGGLSRAKYRTGVTRYIAISRHVADTLAAGGVDPGRISVVYSGVPFETAPRPASARLEARDRLGIPDDRPVLALAGALTPEKGHDLAIAALQRMRNSATLVFLGEGPLRGRLESRTRRLGLKERTVFAGFRPDLDQLWPAFDLLLAPSTSEGLGTAVLEAMGSGLAVVASAAGGLAEILEGGRGGVVMTSFDPEGWARTVDRLLENEAELSRLARAGRERAREFSPERMIRGTEEVYLNLFPARTGITAGPGLEEVGS